LADRQSSEPDEEENIPAELGIFPLRGGVIYPYLPQQLTASRPAAIKVTEAAAATVNLLGVFAQRRPGGEEPTLEDLHSVGTVAKIHKLWRIPDGSVRLIVQGLARATLVQAVHREPYLKARIRRLEDQGDRESMVVQAMRRTVIHQFQSIVKLTAHLPDELQVMVMNIDHPGRLADFIASNLNLPQEEHQKLLACLDLEKRLEYLTELLARELEILEVGQRIQVQVQEKLGKSQREYYLREQLKQIQKELRGSDPQAAELEELRGKLQTAQLSREAMEAAERELDRLAKMGAGSAEYSVARTYLDWLIGLPWSRATVDRLDIVEAARILDEDHYGLEKIKERILEFLAVRALRQGMKGPILCFVGPPGVGKTSLGRSIARSLGRKFVRISLGGVRDEAEIRGHRRTYVGALPGRILQGLRKAGTNNPVFVLDEIDKLGADFRGDPAAALLEVLDPEQNYSFTDHYLDMPFDLSGVTFIATANLTATIPGPLLDRMEEIGLSGYTPDEKRQIARRHLLPRQLAEHGLGPDHLTIADRALERLIGEYTREAGLRHLERQLGTLCRKAARRFVEGRQGRIAVTTRTLEAYLGAPPFFLEVAGRRGEIGVATGLAATAAGGEILFVEATRMPGKNNLILTGQLGEVMRESAHAALSYLRSQTRKLGIEPELVETSDIHLHVPAGATPKEGPSAGIALTSALVSLFTGRPVRSDVAMTGEITLRGRVLPVGGIRDKVLGAQRAGIHTVVLPRKNEKDLEEVPAAIRKRMRFALVDQIDEVLALVLRGSAPPRAARKRPGSRTARRTPRRGAR
jgi:ATP-dependent Lon protease